MKFPAKLQSLWKKFSKIDKKFVSQSILEVGHFTHFELSVKKLLNLAIIIKIHQIYYRICYTKNQGFEKTPLFFLGGGGWNAQLLESIVRRIFIDFGKLFCKVVVISVESPFLPSKTILGVRKKICRLGKIILSFIGKYWNELIISRELWRGSS